MQHLTTPEPTLCEEGASYSLGVLGGMGPLASAEFLKTIYECSVAGGEQHSPRVIMYSDPAFPDRTEALLDGRRAELLSRLAGALEVLCGWGVTEVVVCCITIHHLLPELPEHLRQRVASLLDPMLERAGELQTRQLMLCTNGARRLKVFERHEGWARARASVVMPEGDDQQRVHELIYEIKRNGDLRRAAATLDELLTKYRAGGFVAGCTEMHVLAKSFMAAAENRERYLCTDPLAIIAERLAAGRAVRRVGAVGS